MVTIHTAFPANLDAFFTKLPAEEKPEEMLCRVLGGMMSTRAASLSAKVSSTERSDSTEERESVLAEWAEAEEAYGELSSFSSTISTLTIFGVVVG